MICTNDGDLSQSVTHPSFSREKEYLCLVKGTPSLHTIDRLHTGVHVSCEDGEYLTKPARLRVLTPEDMQRHNVALEKGCQWVFVVIREGRKRQVRRMMEAVGHPVYELKRIRIGGLSLDIPEGEWRSLTRSEISNLLEKPKK